MKEYFYAIVNAKSDESIYKKEKEILQQGQLEWLWVHGATTLSGAKSVTTGLMKRNGIIFIGIKNNILDRARIIAAKYVNFTGESWWNDKDVYMYCNWKKYRYFLSCKNNLEKLLIETSEKCRV